MSRTSQPVTTLYGLVEGHSIAPVLQGAPGGMVERQSKRRAWREERSALEHEARAANKRVRGWVA